MYVHEEFALDVFRSEAAEATILNRQRQVVRATMEGFGSP